MRNNRRTFGSCPKDIPLSTPKECELHHLPIQRCVGVAQAQAQGLHQPYPWPSPSLELVPGPTLAISWALPLTLPWADPDFRIDERGPFYLSPRSGVTGAAVTHAPSPTTTFSNPTSSDAPASQVLYQDQAT